MCRFRTQPIIAKTLESIYRWKGLELRDYLTHGKRKPGNATAAVNQSLGGESNLTEQSNSVLHHSAIHHQILSGDRTRPG